MFAIALSQLEVSVLSVYKIGIQRNYMICLSSYSQTVSCQFVRRTQTFPITPHQLYKELLRKLLLIHIYLSVCAM